MIIDPLKTDGTGAFLIEQFTELALGIAEQAVVLRAGAMHYAGDADFLRNDATLLGNVYFGTSVV